MRALLAAAVLGGLTALAPTTAHASCVDVGDRCLPWPCVEPVYDEVDHTLGDQLPDQLFACLA